MDIQRANRAIRDAWIAAAIWGKALPIVMVCLLLATTLLGAALLGCRGGPREATPADDLSRRITSIEPANPYAISSWIKVSQDLDTALEEGTVSEKQGDRLAGELETKFNGCVKARADELDPSQTDFFKNWEMLANFQISDIYGRWCSKTTAEHVENKLRDMLDQWVRARADELDPSQTDFMDNFETLINVQETDRYTKWCPKDTHEYKESKLGYAFNQWVRVKVDELDPADTDFTKKIDALVALQKTEIYGDWCSWATHEYKEQRLQALLALTPEVPAVPEVPVVPEMPEPRGALTEPQCDLSDFFAWDSGEQVEGYPWANLHTVTVQLIETQLQWDLTLCEPLPVGAQLELEIAIDADGNPDTGATRPPEDEWPPYTAYNDIGVDYIIWGALHGITVEGEGGVTIIEPRVERVGIDKFTGEGDFPWEPIETEIVALELVSVEPIMVRFSFPAEEWDVMVGLTPPAEEVKLPEALDFVVYTTCVVPPYDYLVVDVIPDEGHGTWQRD